MKTFYGQMTKEQLDRAYFVPETLEDMNAFIDMCEMAGYHYSGTKNNTVQVGVNLRGDDWARCMGLSSSYYKEEGLTRINWAPESERSLPVLKRQLSEAIAKRDKRKAKAQKAADKLNQAEKQVHRLIAELENEVESIGGISCKIAEMTKPEIPKGVDVDDPETWQAGDVVECVIAATAAFKVCKEYVLDKGVQLFVTDENGHNIGFPAMSKFRFVRRP